MLFFVSVGAAAVEIAVTTVAGDVVIEIEWTTSTGDDVSDSRQVAGLKVPPVTILIAEALMETFNPPTTTEVVAVTDPTACVT